MPTPTPTEVAERAAAHRLELNEKLRDGLPDDEPTLLELADAVVTVARDLVESLEALLGVAGEEG